MDTAQSPLSSLPLSPIQQALRAPVRNRMIDPFMRDELTRRKSQINVDKNDMEQVLVHVLHSLALDGDHKSFHQLSEHYLTGNKVPEDPYFAFRLIQFAAEQGYEPAFLTLGKCYAYGHGTPKHPEKAAHWLLQTDYSKDMDSLAFMAHCYYNGIGVAKEEQKAYDHWVDAATKGHPDGFRSCQIAADAGYARGQFTLGLFYQDGIGIPADIQAALRLFHRAAEQNHAPAQCRLGILYAEENYGIEKDPEVAIQWLQLAAAQNDPDAQLRLAHCLATGEGVEQNQEEATKRWRKLALEGNATAQYCLGSLLSDENYGEYKPEEGIDLLRKSAEQNYASAQTALGVLYYHGRDDVIKPDWQEARIWLQKAAEQKDYVAQYTLGELCFNGDDDAVNYEEAFGWYKKSSEAGYIPAHQKLAHCYLHGLGTPTNELDGYTYLAFLATCDDEEALTLLQSAARSGNPVAEYGMGLHCRDKQDLETAYEWIEKAADKGENNALFTLAMRYENEGDDEQKLRYCRLAAEKGNAAAQYRLALFLENVPDKKAPENEEAFKWMKAAAEQELAHANYCLGNFYRSGTWVEADDKMAFECYEKAAKEGNSDGIERLGECYASGAGVEMDENVAFQLFQIAAEMGNPKGQCYLGIAYLSGRGCHQDTAVGFQWISQAVDSGLPVVFQILQGMGLDNAKFSDGYKRSQKLWATATGEWFGEHFDREFNETPTRIAAVAPGSSE